MNSPELPSQIESNKQKLLEFYQKPVGAWDLTAAVYLGGGLRKLLRVGIEEGRADRNGTRAGPLMSRLSHG